MTRRIRFLLLSMGISFEMFFAYFKHTNTKIYALVRTTQTESDWVSRGIAGWKQIIHRGYWPWGG